MKEKENDVASRSINFEIAGYDTQYSEISNTYYFDEYDPGSSMMSYLLYTPLTYFVRNTNFLYDLYASVLVNREDELLTPTIVQQGATYFVTIRYRPAQENTTDSQKIVYIQFKNIPVPIGYTIASLTLVIERSITGVGNDEGSKTTTVDYADADEEIPLPPFEGQQSGIKIKPYRRLGRKK